MQWIRKVWKQRGACDGCEARARAMIFTMAFKQALCNKCLWLSSGLIVLV